MSRKVRMLAILLAASLFTPATANAQSAPRPTLGERIEQFGRELFGGGSKEPQTPPNGHRPPMRTRENLAQRPQSPRSSTPQTDSAMSARRRYHVPADETPAGRATTRHPLPERVADDRPSSSVRSTRPPLTRSDASRGESSPLIVENPNVSPPRMGSLPGRSAGVERPPRMASAPDKPLPSRAAPATTEPMMDRETSEGTFAPRPSRSLEERLSAARQLNPYVEQRTRRVSDEQRTSPRSAPPVARPAEPRVASRPARPEPVDEPDDRESATPVESVEAPPEIAGGLPFEVPDEEPLEDPVELSPPVKVEEPKVVDKPKPTAAVEAPRATPQPAEDGVLFVRQSPVLAVETAGPRSIKIGEPAQYKVTLHNHGNVPGNDVVALVKIPEWTDVVGTESSHGTTELVAAEGQDAVISWKIGQLAAQGRAELELSIVPRKSLPFDLAIEWQHAPVMSQTKVEVQEPKLVLEIDGPEEAMYGEEETYQLIVENPGTGDAENVVLRLVADSPGEDDASTHPIGTVGAGQRKVVELELTARQPGDFVIQAEAVASGGLETSIEKSVLIRRAELAVAMQGPQFQYAGTVATYRVTVKNTGTATARNLEVKAALPSEAKHVGSSERGRVEVSQHGVVWSLVSLAAGDEREFEIRCELLGSGEIRPEVRLTAADDLAASASTTTRVEAVADLALEIHDPVGPMPIGEEAVYEVRLRNRGTKTAEDIDVAAFFSEGIEPTSATGAEYQVAPGQIVFNKIRSLAAGEEIVLHIHAVAESGGNHAFRVEVKCEPLATQLAAQENTLYFDAASDAAGTVTQ